MAFSYTNIDTTGITTGGTIQATHITNIHTAVNSIGSWFTNPALPGKLKLFASVTGEASLFFPAGTAPTSLSDGDMWREGDALKMRVSSNQTRTIAFTETATFTTLSLTTLTTSGLLTGNSLEVTTTSVFNGATALNGATTITASADPAFSVGDSGGVNFRINTAANSVELRGGTSFSVFNAANTATLFQVTSTGNTSVNNLSVSGDVTGSVNFTGTINVAGTISRNNVAYLAPASLHTTGFTINLGNGVNAISSGAQLPVVILPYACQLDSWAIVTNDTASANVNNVAISLTIEKRGTGTNTSFASVANTTMSLSSGNSRASGSFSGITFAAGEAIRLVSSGTPTAKFAAVHIRVLRTA